MIRIGLEGFGAAVPGGVGVVAAQDGADAAVVEPRGQSGDGTGGGEDAVGLAGQGQEPGGQGIDGGLDDEDGSADGRDTADRQVSIHAPPRGSDNNHEISRIHCAVSIHAPPRGSDLTGSAGAAPLRRFNPRSPARERRPIECARQLRYKVSIHAPPRGSDGRSRRNRHATQSFNPRSPARERHIHGTTHQ